MKQQHQLIFHTLAVDNPVYLGGGATSQVYSIGQGRVIRIMGQPSQSYIERLIDFYAWLNTHKLPFAVPAIERHGVVAETSYIIERHLPGYDMSTVFPKLDARQRQAALLSFVDGVAALQAIRLPERPFGELLGWQENMTASSWGAFLRQRTLRNLPESLPYLREDLPSIDRLVADFLQRVAHLPNPDKQLLHGDYFLANVMCDETGRLTAVFDFSPLTLVGDPWFDISCTLTFLRVFDFVSEADIAFVERELNGRFGRNPDRIALYATYNALYFANGKEWDPNTYRWCLYHLERYPFL